MYVRHCAFICASDHASPLCGCMYVYIIYMYVWPKQPSGDFSLHSLRVLFFFPPSAIESVITRGASFVYCHVQEGTGDCILYERKYYVTLVWFLACRVQC